MLQANIILAVGGLTGLIGTIVNFKYFGLQTAAIFSAVISILVYFSYYQVICLIKGKCVFSSWLNTIISIITFSGIGVAYYYAINQQMSKSYNQQLLQTNPWISKTASLLENRYNITILE